MLAKPWEKKGAGKTVASVAAKQSARKPWDPATPDVDPRIIQQRKEKTAQGNTYRPEQRFKAQAFAKEYIKDFDHRAAAVRMGVDDEDGSAQRIGRNMLNDPETMQAIQAYMGRIESDVLITRDRVMMGLLREACFHGLGASHAARVAAWGKMAKVLGMELPPKDEIPEEARGGVMLVPYVPGGIEAWEAQATGQQAQLKSDVRN